jgi:hypothetical protein
VNAAPISHAFVLPDDDFTAWLTALRPYTQTFERVAVIRSPAGSDLNRYHTVSAVAAPRTWLNDSPIDHIRRIYPLVVRVDVVHARTPQELSAIVQRRVAQRDRYGERDTNPPHLFDRFVIEYPVEHTPMAIINPFDDVSTPDAHYGVDFAASRGARVVAGAAGIVTQIGTTLDGVRVGRFVTVSTLLNGLTYRVSYIGLDTISVSVNARVARGDGLGTCAGSALKVVIQERTTGQRGYALPEIVDPMRAVYVTNLRLRPKDTNVRVRTLPSASGDAPGLILAQINPWDLVETMEMHGRTLAKVGQRDQWVRVKTADGTIGFAAAWFLSATVRLPARVTGVNPTGVNLDAYHPAGTPPPNQLGKIGWVRLGYNVSAGRGSTDINAAFNRYAPLLERYRRAGYRVILTTSHQTYGEGAGFVWPTMSAEQWRHLIDTFADMAYRIARQYSNRGLVDVWQVWNEPDAHAATTASVPMPADVYRQMLRQVVPAMRAGDAEALVITGGLTGTQGGEAYARQALNGLTPDALPDGIAIHPYGRSPRRSDKYGHFGNIDAWLQGYLNVLPGRQLWITEWGVLDAPNENPRDIGDYAVAVIEHVKKNYRDQVAALVWYAWAQGMHNGYGLVDERQAPRPGLTERFLNA